MVELAAIYDSEEERARLAAILAPRYVALLRATHAVVMDNIPGVPIERLPLTDEAIRAAVDVAMEQVVRIDETTQAALQAELATALDAGYSAWELAHGVPADGYGGIAGLFTETWASRPELVATTELATALNFASLDRYAATGLVDRLQIVEHTDTDAECAARNGQVVPLSERPGLLHPRCRVGLVPIVRAAPAAAPSSEAP